MLFRVNFLLLYNSSTSHQPILLITFQVFQKIDEKNNFVYNDKESNQKVLKLRARKVANQRIKSKNGDFT